MKLYNKTLHISKFSVRHARDRCKFTQTHCKDNKMKHKRDYGYEWYCFQLFEDLLKIYHLKVIALNVVQNL